MTNTEKVLFVDDDRNILAAFKRQLRGEIELETAVGAEEAFKVISQSGPFAVVLSDMTMPGMNGVDLLRRVKEQHPQTVRAMLTGNADQDTAMRALNEGAVYRFVNKPVSSEDLLKTLADCISLYRVQMAEKELLQKTLGGSVKLLTDFISLFAPRALANQGDLRHIVRAVAQKLGLKNSWELELASTLLPLADCLLPAELAAKAKQGANLNPAEKEALSSASVKCSALISNIPRLEGVARLIALQPDHSTQSSSAQSQTELTATRILRAVTDLKDAELRVKDFDQAFATLQQQPERYGNEVIEALRAVIDGEPKAEHQQERTSHAVTLKQLMPGQRLLADLLTRDGVLLIATGALLSPALIAKVQNYAALVGIAEPLMVDCLIPTLN